jgi:hypothetical protein
MMLYLPLQPTFLVVLAKGAGSQNDGNGSLPSMTFDRANRPGGEGAFRPLGRNS